MCMNSALMYLQYVSRIRSSSSRTVAVSAPGMPAVETVRSRSLSRIPRPSSSSSSGSTGGLRSGLMSA